jgi:hypothetical protein
MPNFISVCANQLKQRKLTETAGGPTEQSTNSSKATISLPSSKGGIKISLRNSLHVNRKFLTVIKIFNNSCV